MAVKTIETKAVITASDQTGTTFRDIAEKLKNMEFTAKRAGGTTSRLGSSIASISPKAAAASAAIGMIGGAAIMAATKGIAKLTEFAGSIVHIGEEYDKLVRKQRAVLNISESQQEPLIKQAIHLGATTPFNDIQVLQAQTALTQRGIALEFVQPIVEAAATFAQALGIDLPTAAQQAESAFFASGQSAKDSATAQKSFNALISSMVKTSQVSGMGAEGLAQYYKFGLPSATAAHIPLPYYEALGAALHRAGIPGEEAGVAVRSFVGAMLHPTAMARNVLDAMGVRYGDFATAGAMSAENLSATMQRRLGRVLTPAEMAAAQRVMSNPEIAGEQGAFTAETVKALGGDNLKPADAKKLAKVIGDFWTASLANIDVYGLLKAVLAHNPTAAQGVGLVGGRQGGRFALLSEHAADIANFERQIGAAPADLAQRQAAEQMGGFAGAMARMRGGWMNVETNLFRANEQWMTALADDAAKLETAFVDLGPGAAKFATGLAGATAALLVFQSALIGARILDKAAGGGTWLGAAAAGGVTAARLAAGALRWGLAGAGLYGLYETVKPMAANAGENEFARQRARGLGAFRLGNAPPDASKFTPWPAGLKPPVAELKGAANVNLKVDLGLDNGLIARQVQQFIDTGGAMRKGDVGVSMVPP